MTLNDKSAPLVLLLEPDITARTPLAAYLRDCGYKVVEATTTDEAMQVLGKGLVFDAALVNVQAQGSQDSFAVTQWLRSNAPNTNAVMAASAEAAVRKATDLCQAHPSVATPYDHSTVLDLIKRLRAERDRKD